MNAQSQSEAPQVIPLTGNRLAIVPMAIPLEAECVGVNDTQIIFDFGDRERTFELPFGEGTRVRIETHRIEVAGRLESFEVAVPDPNGSHKIEVVADRGVGRWFVAGRVCPHTV